MPYTLAIHKRVQKFIESRSKKERLVIKEKFLELTLNPHFYNESLDIKKMQNTPFCRLRIGSYRFIYEIDEDVLVLYMVDGGNRGDVY